MTLMRGWHPDPFGEGERFHDGTRWTGVTRGGTDGTGSGAPGPRATRSRRPSRWRSSRSTGVTVLITTIAIALLGASAAMLHRGPLVPLARSVGIARPHRLLPAVVPAKASDAYSVLNRDAAGDPVTYDPCKPIHYVINPDGAPGDYLTFIQAAVGAAQRASGLQFIYDGITTDTWADRQKGDQPGPVLIAFTPTLDSPKATKDTVGLGGSTLLKLNGQVLPHYVTGAIALKRDWFRQESAEHRIGEERAVVMHELGHVLGLGHVEDKHQVMYPSSSGLTSYGAGDLAGLALEGSGACAY